MSIWMNGGESIPYASGNLGTAAYHGSQKVWPPKSNFHVRTLTRNGPSSQGTAGYSERDRAVYIPMTNSGTQITKVAVDPAECTLMGTSAYPDASGLNCLAFTAAGDRCFASASRMDGVDVLGGVWEVALDTMTLTMVTGAPASGVLVHGDLLLESVISPNALVIVDIAANVTVDAIPVANQPGRYIVANDSVGLAATGTAAGGTAYVFDIRSNVLFRTITHPTGVGEAVAFANNPLYLYTASGGVINRVDIQNQVVDRTWTAPAGADFWSLQTTSDPTTGRAFLYACSASDNSIYVFDDSGTDPVLIDVLKIPTRRPKQLTVYNGIDWAITCDQNYDSDVIYLGPDPALTPARRIGEPWTTVPPHDPYPEVPDLPVPEPGPLPPAVPMGDSSQELRRVND